MCSCQAFTEFATALTFTQDLAGTQLRLCFTFIPIIPIFSTHQPDSCVINKPLIIDLSIWLVFYIVLEYFTSTALEEIRVLAGGKSTTIHRLLADLPPYCQSGSSYELDLTSQQPHMWETAGSLHWWKLLCTTVQGTAHSNKWILGVLFIQLSQGCIQLKSLDLSYCNKLSARPDSEALWTLPTTLTELSLCGILLEDADLFVECVTRLKHLTSVRLSGVSALSDETLTKVINLKEKDCPKIKYSLIKDH